MLRADGSPTYEQGVAHWHRSGGAMGIEPIPAELDDDRLAMRLAPRLGVSAPEIRRLPLHWVGSAAVDLEAEALHHKRAMKKAQQKRKQAPESPRRGRR